MTDRKKDESPKKYEEGRRGRMERKSRGRNPETRRREGGREGCCQLPGLRGATQPGGRGPRGCAIQAPSLGRGRGWGMIVTPGPGCPHPADVFENPETRATRAPPVGRGWPWRVPGEGERGAGARGGGAFTWP